MSLPRVLRNHLQTQPNGFRGIAIWKLQEFCKRSRLSPIAGLLSPRLTNCCSYSCRTAVSSSDIDKQGLGPKYELWYLVPTEALRRVT